MSRRDRLYLRTLTAMVAVLTAATFVATLVLVAGSRSGVHVAAPAPGGSGPVVAAPTSSLPSAPPSAPPPSLIATLSAPTAYSATPGGPTSGTLPARNPFGGAEVVAVTGEEGTGPAGWLHVELPIRPNGSAAWVPASRVSLSQTSYRVAVSLAARTLTVTDAGTVVLTTPVAVGQSSTPTPPGSTYLWELIKPDPAGGPYGPYIFGLAEYSDAYTVFNGGDAQIGIHGQDEPWSIGYAASNGCIRLPNDVVTRLAGILPLGTPVTIA